MELRTVHTPTGGSSREFSAMRGTLTEQRRVNEEGLWIAEFCCKGRTLSVGNDIELTVPYQKAPANYVPAAAVIRRERALSGIIGRKGCVDGNISLM